MRCFAEHSGAKYGRATAGVNRIYCVMCPDEVRGECNGVRSDSEASHFFILIILLQRDFFIIVRKFIYFSFLFFQEGLG